MKKKLRRRRPQTQWFRDPVEEFKRRDELDGAEEAEPPRVFVPRDLASPLDLLGSPKFRPLAPDLKDEFCSVKPSDRVVSGSSPAT
jgi:hypothetical protein